jgi:Pyruvate/2-oxoacid:ferredoxin oxidoreductase gamma subunit
VHVLARPFTQLANELGDARAGNMLMLGVLLEIAEVLPDASVDAALRRLVKNPRWVALDERALAKGRELYKESVKEVAHTN